MTNPNDCAYPADSATHTESGLTKREHFAGLALQGLLSNVDTLRELRRESGDNWDEYNRLVAGFCTMMADALIVALNKPTNNDQN